MVKELLSDFDKITQPSYQTDSFQPYVSVILTVIIITILAYGFQTTTADIHTYAANPTALKNSVLQIKSCNDFSKTSLTYICKGVQDNGENNDQSGVLLS